MIALLISILLAANAQAQTVSSFVRAQVGTLPQGRFILSYNRIMADSNSIFNRDGQRTSLTDYLNQEVSFRTIAEDDPSRTQQLLGLFQAYGADPDSSAGEIDVSVLGSVNAEVPVVGYGLNDRTGLFLAIPIIRFQFQNQ